MTDSLRVLTAPQVVAISTLSKKAEDVIRLLIGQSENISISLEFKADSSPTPLVELEPNGVFGTIFEKQFADAGAFFSYGIDEDWKTEDGRPQYVFSIDEIPREEADGLLLVCGAVAIAFAQCVGVDAIVDHYGVWGEPDMVSIDKILALGIGPGKVPSEALVQFYSRLPGLA